MEYGNNMEYGLNYEITNMEQRKRRFPGEPERDIRDPYREDKGPREDVKDRIRKSLGQRKRMEKQQGGE